MSAACLSSISTFSINLSNQPERSFSTLPTRKLVTPRRFDLAVKHRLFCHLLRGGNDPDAERVYLWHIAKRSGHRIEAGVATDRWKRSLDDYLSSAKALYGAMVREGFDPAFPVPVDPDGEILDGSHRVACALALGIEAIPVVRMSKRVWAPAWGEQWFRDNGLSEAGLERLRQDWKALAGSGS